MNGQTGQPRAHAPHGRAGDSDGDGTSIGFDGANHGWITTDDGFLMSQDGGETWKLQPTETQLFLNKVLRNSGTTWALGPFGMLKQTGPTQWKKIVNPLSSNAAAEDPK